MQPLTDEARQLGQFIPVHYHHNMLQDEARMRGFRQALAHVVKPGMRVLELGGGTGVLSYFAAEQAGKVWCVERNPALVATARQMLARNPHGHKVEVIHADAFDYLPPEPVDVVICEMLHVGLLREKQVEVIQSFKKRYMARFGIPLPIFVPEACIQGFQLVQQDFVYEGYYAATPVFQNPVVDTPRTLALADPVIYQSFCYDERLPTECQWHGIVRIDRDGELNALRFITKNILSIVRESATSIDWHNAYLVLPLADPLAVRAGDEVEIAFRYPVGAPLETLHPKASIQATRLVAAG